MRDYKNRHIILYRIRPASFGLMLLVFSGILFLSCDEVDRHEALTFFFDGVPPLGAEGLQGEFLDPNSREYVKVGQPPAWYVHEPRKDCSICHGKRKQRSFSSRIYLKSPVPKLCYNCHADYTTSAPFVHGPVAVGQCLFCHNPHKSKIEHLLTAPEPGLCYLCHDVDTIELIAAHLPKQLSECTNCHNAHASSNNALLKGGSSEIYNGNGVANTAEPTSQDYISAAKGAEEQIKPKLKATASETSPESKSLAEVFRETSRLIEQGKLRQARAYLGKFKDSNSFTAEEKAQIARVITMIDSALSGNNQQLDNDKQIEEKAEEIAELYYSSMAFYRAGQLLKAREGFVKILNSGIIPESMAKTIRGYVSDIDNSLAGNKKSK